MKEKNRDLNGDNENYYEDIGGEIVQESSNLLI
jgi:hypothetical protein